MNKPAAKAPTSRLPSMEYPFDIQVTGNETRDLFIGKFKYRRPSCGARSRIDAMRARLNNDLITLDQDTLDFNMAISHLRFTLDDYPEWWVASSYGMDLYDYNVVAELYNRCMAFEEEWKKKVYSGEGTTVAEGDPTNAVKEAVVNAQP